MGLNLARCEFNAASTAGKPIPTAKKIPKMIDTVKLKLSRNITPNIPTPKYHSGASVSDQSEFEDWYRDWKEALPQTP